MAALTVDVTSADLCHGPQASPLPPHPSTPVYLHPTATLAAAAAHWHLHLPCTPEHSVRMIPNI